MNFPQFVVAVEREVKSKGEKERYAVERELVPDPSVPRAAPKIYAESESQAFEGWLSLCQSSGSRCRLLMQPSQNIKLAHFQAKFLFSLVATGCCAEDPLSR